jgi:uncharacterized protein involved in exopolysaccharide biosynthesis
MTSEFDLRTILIALKPHRVPIVIGLLVGGALAVTHAALSPEEFESTVEVAPAASPSGTAGLGSVLGQLGALAPLAGINIPSPEEDRTALVVLRSNAFVGEFLREEGVLEQIREENRGALARLRDRRLNEQQAIRYFRTRLMRVEEDRRAGTTKLTIRSRDREAAARWANGMIHRLNAAQRERAIEESTRTVAYLEEQIEHASSVEVQQALYSVMEGELKAIAIARSREDYTFRILDPAVPALESEAVAPNTRLRAIVGGLAGCVIALLISLFLTRRR